MPKSSSASRTPNSLRILNVLSMVSLSPMKTLSVSSSSSRSGSRPLEASAFITISGKPLLANCTTDTLTATRTDFGQFNASWQARRNAHSPNWLIRFSSSAIGMNTSGLTPPRSGWTQRMSASNPTIM